jgi:hypothetical protein
MGRSRIVDNNLKQLPRCLNSLYPQYVRPEPQLVTEAIQYTTAYCQQNWAHMAKGTVSVAVKQQ